MRRYFFVLFVVSLASCTFDYSTADASGDSVPQMVLTDAKAQRYENSRLAVEVNAKVLELYDADKVWAGKDVSFTQYKNTGSGEVEAQGFAGLLLVDDGEESYFLGSSVSFRVMEDGITLEAPDLRWQKKTHSLSGPADGAITLAKDDGSSIIGTGFFADTLSRRYVIDRAVSGALRNSGDAE